MRAGRAQATRIAARIGQGAAFAFALIGLFTNPMLILIGLFVYLAATAEAQHVAFNDANHDLPVSAAMVRTFEALPPSATLDDAVDLMLRTSQHEFPVLDGSGGPRGLLTRDGLIVALRQGGPTTPVLDVVTRDLPVAGSREPFDAALARCWCAASARTGASGGPGRLRPAPLHEPDRAFDHSEDPRAECLAGASRPRGCRARLPDAVCPIKNSIT
jgi:hypothetical protein